MIIVRFADDAVVGFEHREDAERFWAELRDRLAEFSLELNAEKTRLIEFGRFAAQNRAERGLGKPETFHFLGFTHICAKTRNGRFKLKRITDKKRMRAKLSKVKAELIRRRDLPIPDQGRWLASVLRGHFSYYAVPDNSEAISAFHFRIIGHWLRALRRRSQRHRMTWERIGRLADRWLPPPRILHPWPNNPLCRHHPRQEPSALAAPAGICAGGSPSPQRRRAVPTAMTALRRKAAYLPG